MDKKWGLLVHLGGELNKRMLRETVFDMDMWNEYVDHCEKCGVNFIVLEVGGSVQWESHPELVVKGAWSKEFVKRNLQPMTNVGKKLHRGIFISKLNVPEIALGNSGKICKLVGGQISLCSQLCDSFSNVHIVSHSMRIL